MNPFSFSISFSKKLMKVSSGSLFESSSFFNCDKIVCGILLSANLCVYLMTSLINYAVSSILSEGLYLYLILLTSQNTIRLAYSSSVLASFSLIIVLIKRVKAYLIIVFD